MGTITRYSRGILWFFFTECICTATCSVLTATFAKFETTSGVISTLQGCGQVRSVHQSHFLHGLDSGLEWEDECSE